MGSDFRRGAVRVLRVNCDGRVSGAVYAVDATRCGEETDAARYGERHEGLALQPDVRHRLDRNHDGKPNISASYNTLGFLSPLLKWIRPDARDITETICS